ncbi:MAG: hypothetical protein DWQ36_23105 [Acidobacteria bacterium]|nr:MAG: hypothetical protein DWQ30_21550 [Acidobacteriota bacterium]REK00457.1 MAG: hypothetical protein DWQ36_23105 [Acidobacteriota bacterium]
MTSESNQLRPGSTLDGKYEVLARIGGGGMGEVYRVRHLHLDEVRVIKLLRADLASSAQASESFQREARLATQIKHPRVATLHDYSRLADGSFYMVWESIEGRDVDQWVRTQGVFPIEIAVPLAVQGLSGLEAIHHAHIVHRDLSPDNVMITTDARGHLGMKIIDLGLAGDLREILAPGGDPHGAVGGKINYCSPEHVGLVEGVRPDHLSDVFGFGIVLYFMICGQLPFDRVGQPSDIKRRFEQGAYPLRGRSEVEVPQELSDVLARALQVDRSARFQAASEFREALQALASGGNRQPRPRPRFDIDEPLAAAATALRQRRFDDARSLLDELSDLAPADPRVLQMRAELDEVRSTQRQIQVLQMREMVQQYLQARHEPMARAALESLLEIDPDYPEREELERQLEALHQTTSSGRRARELVDRVRRDLGRVADRPVLEEHEIQQALAEARAMHQQVQELEPVLAVKLAGEIEEWRRSQERDQVILRQKQTIRDLIEARSLDDAEAGIDRLAELGAPQVAVDLFRRDLAQLRRQLARDAKIAQIEQELPQAMERGALAAARELARELQNEDPSHPQLRGYLRQISQAEERATRDASAKEGAATIAALIEAGRLEEARLALDVLRRIAPQHGLIPHFERRLGAGRR